MSGTAGRHDMLGVREVPARTVGRRSQERTDFRVWKEGHVLMSYSRRQLGPGNGRQVCERLLHLAHVVLRFRLYRRALPCSAWR